MIVTAFDSLEMAGLSSLADSLVTISTSRVADASGKVTDESDEGDNKPENTGRCFFTTVTLVSSSFKRTTLK